MKSKKLCLLDSKLATACRILGLDIEESLRSSAELFTDCKLATACWRLALDMEERLRSSSVVFTPGEPPGNKKRLNKFLS